MSNKIFIIGKSKGAAYAKGRCVCQRALRMSKGAAYAKGRCACQKERPHLRYYTKFDKIEERGYRNYETKHKTNHQNWFCILVDLRVLADVQQCDTADPYEHISHE